VCVGVLVGWWVGVVCDAMRCDAMVCDVKVGVARAWFLAELHSNGATTNARTPRPPISTHFGPTRPLRVWRHRGDQKL
jgi:hypothetical protein